MDRQNKAINDSFGTIVKMMEEQNRQLRKENLEVKDLLRNSQGGGMFTQIEPSGSQLTEQLKMKDNMIVTLRKEIHELKQQRAESAKQLMEIQQQVTTLKNSKRDPLAPKNDQKQPISLSLKFDDFDKLDRADRL